jgi:PKD repeat protein
LPIAAVPYNTVPTPTTPWANPGTYTVKLTVDGKSVTQPITVKQESAREDIDDRDAVDLRGDQGDVRRRRRRAGSRAAGTGSARSNRRTESERPPAPVADAVAAVDKKLEALIGAGAAAGPVVDGPAVPVAVAEAADEVAVAARGRPATGRPFRQPAPAGPPPPATLSGASSALSARHEFPMQGADVQPTANQLAAIAAARKTAAEPMSRWVAIKTVDLPALNLKLKAAGVAVLKVQ